MFSMSSHTSQYRRLLVQGHPRDVQIIKQKWPGLGALLPISPLCYSRSCCLLRGQLSGVSSPWRQGNVQPILNNPNLLCGSELWVLWMLYKKVAWRSWLVVTDICSTLSSISCSTSSPTKARSAIALWSARSFWMQPHNLAGFYKGCTAQSKTAHRLMCTQLFLCLQSPETLEIFIVNLF